MDRLFAARNNSRDVPCTCCVLVAGCSDLSCINEDLSSICHTQQSHYVRRELSKSEHEAMLFTFQLVHGYQADVLTSFFIPLFYPLNAQALWLAFHRREESHPQGIIHDAGSLFLWPPLSPQRPVHGSSRTCYIGYGLTCVLQPWLMHSCRETLSPSRVRRSQPSTCNTDHLSPLSTNLE